MRQERWWPLLLPIAVGAISLAITFWLWRHEQLTTQHALKAEFDFSVRQTAHRIEARIVGCEQMLRAVQGLFQVAEPVRRESFEAYVDNLLAGGDFAGIQFLAHAPKRLAADGQPTAAIAFAAPALGLNLKAIGNDPFTDPLSRAAMLLAGDSGGVAITPLLPGLIAGQPSSPPGLMMFLPVYAQGRPLDSAAARRAALTGWVAIGLRVQDLMSSLYGEGIPGIDLAIHDGVQTSRETLLYASLPERPAAQRPVLETLEYVGIAGHTWTLALSAGPEFVQRAGGDSAQIFAGAGIAFSLLLALLMRQLVSGGQRARTVVSAVTGELRASEERYRLIVETADEGIWMTDAQSRTTFVNPKLTQMLGYSRDDFLGREWAHFLDDSAASDAERSLGGSRPISAAGPRELRFRRKDGGLLWASMTSTPIFDAAGAPAGALAMLTDIGTKKQADATRAELEAQLRESQKMEAVGTLAGGIAHDFNNILAAILGSVDLARDRLAPGQGGAAELAQIGTAATRARSLVQQILAFSRRQPHRLESQPLAPVIEESARLLRPLLPALAELDVLLPAQTLTVAADATQLQQVLMNLCTNAWHALQGRAGRITIGLDALSIDAASARRLGLAAGRHAHLWVSDNGCGMDESTRSRVFEPFFTTKPVGQGTGLGLSVVHGIVATHGGAITVASQPGQGTRFDLFLPLLETPPAPPPAALPQPEPASTAGRHVLYVDDDPVMVTMVQALLQRAGYRVSCFEDPRAAVQAVSARPGEVDIVVSDYNMPGQSGLDLARELSAVRPDLPVVISSGFVTDEILARAAQAGVRQVLQKEYTLERLPAIVHAVLAERQPPAPTIADRAYSTKPP